MSARQPAQVLVIPFRPGPNGIEVLALRRRDLKVWQFVAGGAQDRESMRDAALREAQEELGAPIPGERVVALQTVGCVPRYHFREAWPASVRVIPEHAFAVDCCDLDLNPVQEHDLHQWLSPAVAWAMLRFDSNRTALWELCQIHGTVLDVEGSWRAR